jgi:putative Mg2+ transporter-C (MgtC) family protein
MDQPITFWETAVRLALALLGGAVLGWEREYRDKPAGLRTHMMVALGSAVFVVISLRLAHEMNVAAGTLQFDPLRVLQGIIGGIGFLGAGVIIRAGGKVHGLTTAASIWLSAAIGVTCGLGFYDIAGLGAALGLAVLLLVGFIEYRFSKSRAGEDSDTPPTH